MERNELVNQIESIFGDLDVFLDIVQDDDLYGYDIIQKDEEVYIIDTEHCQYLNWYKLTHVGRAMHTDMDDTQLIEFLKRMYKKYLEQKAEETQ